MSEHIGPRPSETAGFGGGGRGWGRGVHLFVVEVEVDGGGGLGGGVGFEVGFVFEAHHAGDEEGGEAVAGGVVVADGVVEAAAFDGDAIFSAFELGLEVAEVLAGFQVRISFGDDEEAGEGGWRAGLGLAGIPGVLRRRRGRGRRRW